MQILLSVVGLVLVLGAVIFIHELGHFVFAKLSKIKVNEFALGMGPRIAGFKKGETEYNLRLFPIGGFVAMEGEDEESDDNRSYAKAPVGKRIAVIVAGAMLNLILGFSIILGVNLVSNELLPTRQVHSFRDDMTATTQQSGLQAGDVILAVNGRRMLTYADIQYELTFATDGMADLLVRREDEEVLLEDVQFSVTETDDGIMLLQLDFYFVGIDDPSFVQVLEYSFLESVDLGRQVYFMIFDLIAGRASIKVLSGPIGIASVVGEAMTVSFRYVLYLTALISINLGIVNLLPLPALDGGKLILLLIEAVTKKQLDVKYESIINMVGFALLILLMVIVTYNDIVRLITG